MSRTPALALVACVAACAGAALPAPPRDVWQVAVLPTVNRTGRELAVSGDTWLQRALGDRRVTIPEVLAERAAAVLVERGFRVVEPAAGTPALRFELTRWEPDPSGRLAFIGVDVRLDLLAADGALVWSASRARWTVPVRGAPSAAVAGERAARAIAEAFLADWRPAR